MSDSNTFYRWSFQRLGGLDQVVLSESEAIRRLNELDPKLWVALSCPIAGLDFHARTLTLIDTDNDGRIRLPELVAATTWLCGHSALPARIINAPQELPLSAIAATADGARLTATGRAILDALGKTQLDSLSEDDVAHAMEHAAKQSLNGDGIVPPLEEFTPEMRSFIQDAMTVTGAVRDASGKMGINAEIATAFVATLAQWKAWQNSVQSVPQPLGSATDAGWTTLDLLKEKIDDYFMRCDLAAYAPHAEAALNVDENFATQNTSCLVDQPSLASLPLARIAPNRPLSLTEGINPAWRTHLARFADLFAALLSQNGQLTREQWVSLQERFAPYAASLANKPAAVAASASQPPAGTVDALGAERIAAILDSSVAADFAVLAEKDLSVPVTAADIAAVERLVLYHKYLYRLLNNFVSFAEFYEPDGQAAFQAGTLYIDGRSCRLCVLADNPDEHASLASLSYLCLLYCTCTRTRSTEEETAPLSIVAAVTAGDADLLLEKRHGVFIDNEGHDWDATVVKVVNNPIGLWQAAWSPYKRFGRMVTAQIEKLASSKDTSLDVSAGKAIGQLTPPVTAKSTPVAKPEAKNFDISKNVGIFAAVGLALGALGTAAGSIAKALFSLQWWQFPLLILGIIAVISVPSMVMAWLKLRQRTLGPLLEASGWAINGRVFINHSLAACLTGKAHLPRNARRNSKDPLRDTRSRNAFVFIAAVLIGAVAVATWLWLNPEMIPSLAFLKTFFFQAPLE